MASSGFPSIYNKDAKNYINTQPLFAYARVQLGSI